MNYTNYGGRENRTPFHAKGITTGYKSRHCHQTDTLHQKLAHHGPNRLRQEISDLGLSVFARRHGEHDGDRPELFLSSVVLLLLSHLGNRCNHTSLLLQKPFGVQGWSKRFRAANSLNPVFNTKFTAMGLSMRRSVRGTGRPESDRPSPSSCPVTLSLLRRSLWPSMINNAASSVDDGMAVSDTTLSGDSQSPFQLEHVRWNLYHADYDCLLPQQHEARWRACLRLSPKVA